MMIFNKNIKNEKNLTHKFLFTLFNFKNIHGLPLGYMKLFLGWHGPNASIDTLQNFLYSGLSSSPQFCILSLYFSILSFPYAEIILNDVFEYDKKRTN